MKRLICEKGFTVIELVIFLVVAVGAWGWVWNIVKIFGSSFDPLTGVVILRCIGIFMAPLGCIMGFL